jgi:glucose/arabinose dehydrogenase
MIAIVRWTRALGTVCLVWGLAACSDEATVAPAGETRTIEPSAAVAANTQVTVQVPASMTAAPFNVPRQLTVPTGFQIAVYARVTGARFMAVTPDGNLLVSRPGNGRIVLVRPNASGDPLVSDFATGLSRPHDLVFTTIGTTTYLYVSEKNRVARYTYTPGNLTGQGRQVIVSGLPDASLPELNGNYGHELKNIAISSAGKLYVSIASTCNACTSDDQANPVRASVYEYNLDGSGARLFARGLRNAEGLAFVPGTNTLWVVVNNRDNIAFPNHADWNGDGSDDFGKVMQSYVDNHPPDEFTRVRLGGNYGWPYCNPNPDGPNGLANMPFDRDVQHNASGQVNCGTMDVINRGIQAHSAPLGLLFLQNTNFPSAYTGSAVAALHGSWNRSTNVGYKVVYFPWDAATQSPTSEADLVSGWATANASWGRPVDIAVDAQGAMFISDDKAGAIYKLTQTSAPPPPPPPPGGTLYEAEQAALSAMRVVSFNTGYTGTGYVRFVNATGSYVEWTVNAATAGTYSLIFRYSSASGSRPLEIRVNGAVINPSLAFPPTGSGTNWQTVSLTATLNAGTNLVRATSIGSGGPNMDNLLVK